MEKNIVDKALKSEHGKILPLHTMSGSICSCGKDFFAIREHSLTKDLSSLSLQINHYAVMDSSQSKERPNYFIGAINTALTTQPEQDESSIFDSAWATLRGQPYQSSSELLCDK